MKLALLITAIIFCVALFGTETSGLRCYSCKAKNEDALDEKTCRHHLVECSHEHNLCFISHPGKKRYKKGCTSGPPHSRGYCRHEDHSGHPMCTCPFDGCNEHPERHCECLFNYDH